MSYSETVTQADLKTILENILPIIDFYYPVGSYYETSESSFNPNTQWGGKWVLETPGQVHLSGAEYIDPEDLGEGQTLGTYFVKNAYLNKSDGGEATHVLTPGETATKTHTHTITSHYHSMAHYHSMKAIFGDGSGSGSSYEWTSKRTRMYRNTTTYSGNTSAPNTTVTGSTTAANGTAHNNMQPYIVVYRWHRIF